LKKFDRMVSERGRDFLILRDARHAVHSVLTEGQKVSRIPLEGPKIWCQ